MKFSRTLGSPRVPEDLQVLYDRLRDVAGLGLATGTYPPINVYRDSDKAIVAALMPGVSVGDIDVTVDDNMLCIKGEAMPEKAFKTHKQERAMEPFFRSIAFPFTIDPDSVVARMSMGILKIELARPSHKSTAHKVEVHHVS